MEIDKKQLRQLAKLLDMSEADLSKKFDDEDKTFVWVKRQVDEATAKQIADPTSKASTSVKSTGVNTRKVSLRCTWWALPMSKTSARKV